MDTSEIRRVAISIRRSAPEHAAKLALVYLKKQSFQDLSAASARELMIAFSNNQDIQQFVKTYINKLNDQDLLRLKMLNC